jgi:hypothetical protein
MSSATTRCAAARPGAENDPTAIVLKAITTEPVY